MRGQSRDAEPSADALEAQEGAAASQPSEVERFAYTADGAAEKLEPMPTCATCCELISGEGVTVISGGPHHDRCAPPHGDQVVEA